MWRARARSLREKGAANTNYKFFFFFFEFFFVDASAAAMLASSPSSSRSTRPHGSLPHAIADEFLAPPALALQYFSMKNWTKRTR